MLCPKTAINFNLASLFLKQFLSMTPAIRIQRKQQGASIVKQQKMKIQANKGHIWLSPRTSLPRPTIFVRKHKNHGWLCSRNKCVRDKKYQVVKMRASELCKVGWICLHVFLLSFHWRLLPTKSNYNRDTHKMIWIKKVY